MKNSTPKNLFFFKAKSKSLFFVLFFIIINSNALHTVFNWSECLFTNKLETYNLNNPIITNGVNDYVNATCHLNTVLPPEPEINVTGNNVVINNGDIATISSNNTNFGSIYISSESKTHTFLINNVGTLPLNLTGAMPYITTTGTNASDFILSSPPTSPIGPGESTSFDITFNPSENGLKRALVTITSNDASNKNYSFAIQGFGSTLIGEGPGGVNNNIQLWLKANKGAGIVDGQPLSLWIDQAKNNNATVNLPGQEPTYRDNPNANVNYNAVVDFNNNFSNYPIDYTYADTNRQFLKGDGGFYTDDIYIVLIPNRPASSSSGFYDIFCGDSNPSRQATDASGIGFGSYSVRFENEVLSYAHGTTPNGYPPINERGYGVAETNTTTIFDNVGIINGRHNNDIAATGYELLYNNKDVVNTEVGIPQFGTIDNSKYWIGRSEGYKSSLDGRIVEIIAYSSRNNENPERNKIQSYLAIKYGITLGTNGISQDYIASNNEMIWNTSANAGYNYDIAGIGRDDASDLYQKQSKSVNKTAIVSMALDNTELTNNLNPNLFDTNNEFLIWGNDGNDTNSSSTAITVDLGPDTITTVTDVMNRIWKINETSDKDIKKVEVSIYEADLAGLPPLAGNDQYVMLVAEDSNFTTNLNTVFLNPNTFNGISTREGTYDFDGTKYFTFGVAREINAPRHLGFDGANNYVLVGDKIDLSGRFTASAWIKPDASNTVINDRTIISKNDGVYGYKFFLNADDFLSFSVGNSPINVIQSNTKIPKNIWHHVAVMYDGITASLYIDGVLDTTKMLNSPAINSANFTIGAMQITKDDVRDHFKGDIDEIRIWDEVLTVNQLRYIMNQEIIQNGIFVNGAIIPNTITKNDIATVNWSSLLAYYSMNSFIATHLNDVSGNGNRGELISPDTFSIEFQSSPLPYESDQNRNWDVSATWTNGIEQYAPGSTSIVDPNITIDWNIVKTNHNILMNNTTSLPLINQNNRTVLGLFVDSNILTILGSNGAKTGNGLTVTHYLNLDGKIDLDGESQLIQTQGSDLEITSSGVLERDQQGTKDLYTYNYWGSPVGISNTITNNNSYKFPDVFLDGTNPTNPKTINIITSGYDGTNTSPIGIADYWIWKFSNYESDIYSEWYHVRSTGTLLTGEGFTLKGVSDTAGKVWLEQNYIMRGKPNNGDINLTLNAGNDYLVGNPYASAIDSHQFIIDNAPTIEGTGNTTGTLYFWEHWGGGSHILAEYQGGYATYNLSGGVASASIATSDPDVSPGGTPTKIPGRYIPVAQGFFVSGETTGTIKFNNGQRVFAKEGPDSVFFKESNSSTDIRPDPFTKFTDKETNTDSRMKIRLGFNSVKTIHRQLLVTQDSHATPEIDWGFDGKNIENQIDDMYWMINNEKFTIQGIDVINESTILPIGIHTSKDGINSITIDKLENVSSNLKILLHDKQTETYHDLRLSDFSINLPKGDHLDRFNIVFKGKTLSNENFDYDSTINFYFANNDKIIIIDNPNLEHLKSIELTDIIGQSIFKFNAFENMDYNEIKAPVISSGNYILTIYTEKGKLSKKVLITN